MDAIVFHESTTEEEARRLLQEKDPKGPWGDQELVRFFDLGHGTRLLLYCFRAIYCGALPDWDGELTPLEVAFWLDGEYVGSYHPPTKDGGRVGAWRYFGDRPQDKLDFDSRGGFYLPEAFIPGIND